MGRRILTIFLVAALTVGVVWYFKQPAAEAPVSKTTAAPKADAPKPAPITPVSQIAPPKAPPAPKPTESPKPTAGAAPAPANSDAQAELGTAIDDIANLIQGGNIMALFEKYATPEEQAQMPPEEKAQMEQESAQMMAQPEGQQMIQMMVTALQSLKDQAPEMNATGDEATYQMQMNSPDGSGPPGRSRPMTFVKIDGKWYIKNGI